MNVTQPCPTCGGTGVQQLGMDLHEAAALLLRVDETEGWIARGLGVHTWAPSGRRTWQVRAGDIDDGGTEVVIKSTAQWDRMLADPKHSWRVR